MFQKSIKSAAVAASFLSVTILLTGADARASDLMRLDAAQMDAVTAGGRIVQDTNAEAVGRSRLGAALAVALTKANSKRTDERKAQTYGEATIRAAGDVSAEIDANSLSLIAKNDATYAGVDVSVSGEALGDNAFAVGGIKTKAIERGPVIISWGWGWTYANGETAQTTADTVPLAEGEITGTHSTTRQHTTRRGGTLTITRGFAISINPPKKI